MPSLVPRPPGDLGSLPAGVVRAEVAGAWPLYHSAGFARLLTLLPGMTGDARLLPAVGSPERKAGRAAALGKAAVAGGAPAGPPRQGRPGPGRSPGPRGRSRGRRLRRQRGAFRAARLHPPPHQVSTGRPRLAPFTAEVRKFFTSAVVLPARTS